MILTLAKWTVLLFGIYIVGVGFLMLFAPKKARETLRKAGSTNFINYSEITVRLLVSLGFIGYANYSLYPQIFLVVGWFMCITSLILYAVPRRLHHNYSLKSAEILTPLYFQLLSPITLALGIAIIYSVI